MGWWPWSSGDARRGDRAHGDHDRGRGEHGGGWDGTSPPPPPPPPPRPGHWQDPRRGEDQHGHRPPHNYEQHQQHDQRDNYHQQHHEQPRDHYREHFDQHREPCKFFFAPGGCRYGHNCRFSHEGPPPPNPYEPQHPNHAQNHMQNHSMQNQAQPQQRQQNQPQPMQPRFVPPTAGDRGEPAHASNNSGGTDEFGRAAPGLHPPHQQQAQRPSPPQRQAQPASQPANNSLDGNARASAPPNGANDTASGGNGPGNGHEAVAPSAARGIVDQIQAQIHSTVAPAATAPAATAPTAALRTAGKAGSDKAQGGILKKATVAVATALPAVTGDGAKAAAAAGGEHKKTIRFAPTPEKPKRNPSPDKPPHVRPTNLNAALNRQALGNSHNLGGANHQHPSAAASKPGPSPKKGPNMCTLHNLEHKWHDCPNNPFSPNFCGIDHRSMNLSTDLAKTAQQLKQPPAVLPAAKGKASAARAAAAGSGMFNTSGAARPAMPRKMASDTALGGRAGRPIPRKAASETALGGGGGSIPKKPKFQQAPSAAQQIVEEVQATLSSPEQQGQTPPQPSPPGQRPPPPHHAPQTQQRQQQVRRQPPASGLFNTSRAARPVPRKPPASAEAAAPAPAGHHEHIQSQQPVLSPATKDVVVGYKPGTRGKGRGRGKAPMPTGAIPLQKQRGTRLLAGKKSAFSPRREEEEGAGGEPRPSPGGAGQGSSAGGGAAALDGTPAPVPLAAAAGAGDGGDGSDGNEGTGDDMSVSDSDDEPLVRRATVDAKKQDKRVLRSSDDEGPPRARKRSPVPPKKKTVEYLDDSTSDDDSSDDDVPLRQRYRKQREQKGEDMTPMENCQKEQQETQPEPPEQSSDQNDGTETPRVSDDKSDAAEGGEEDNGKGKGGRMDGSDASMGDDSDVDENDNDDGENGQGSTDMEMEDAMFDDLEQDLFQLVDQTIEVQDRWNKRIESQLEGLTEDWERHERQNQANASNDDLCADGQANEEQLGHGEPGKDDGVGSGLPSATSANVELGAVVAAPHDQDEAEAGANDQGGDVAEKGLPATPAAAHGNDLNESLVSEEERQRVEREKKRRKEEKKAARREKRKLAEKGDGRKAKKQKHGSHSEADADPWTEDEKVLFSKGVEECGQNWGKIANEYVKTRDPFQVREYARRLAKSSEVKQHVASASSTSAGMAIEVDTGLGAFEPVGDDSRTDEEVDEDSEISDDDIIPGFVTCDKCGLVMMDMDEVWAHEKTCTITSEDRLQGRVFNDKHALMIYILNFCNQMGRQLKEDDMIFFGEDFNPTTPDNTAGLDEGSDAPLQGPPDDASRGDPDKEAEGDDDGEDEDEMADMNLVKHLCSTTIDPRTGLPVKKLTVMCGDTETLYDFRVEIKPSNIPGAGYGAFLKYLGARVLNRRAAERSSRLIAEHVIDTSICTRDELMAETLGGRKVTVKLTGDNLHYNDNNIYWSKARSEKYAEYEKEMKRLSASSPRASWSRASTMESFEEDEVLCKVHDEVEKLRKKIPTGQGIGFLGINSHLDYTEDKDKMFWNHPHAFELGRYGPHRPEDRKINLHFDFKNFIHSCEPSEWSYEVPEKMLGHRQIVDITDELTGEVHAEAKKHTPIYVNEVGHNSKLHSNVLIRDKNERSIYYYVSIDEKHAMKKGDEVELLVDYGDHYEQVRERKGYGRVNVSQNVGGDDEDGARLQRNFREREEVENDISSMKVYEMYHLVEFLTEEIFDPIEKSIRRAISDDDGFGTDCNPVMGRQLVARRRLHWIGEKLAGRIQEYVDDPQIVDTSEFISSIRESLQKWQFDSLPKIHPTLNKDLANTLLVELAEELLYKTRSCLPCPLDQTVWSKLAVDLMNRTAQLIAKFLLCYSGAMDLRLQCLGENLLKQARSSTEALQKGAKAINGMGGSPEDTPQELIDLLAFKSRERKLKKKDLLDESSGRMISLYDNDETIRFGAAAAMADIQAYYDAAELCGLEPHFVPGKAGQKLSECGRSIVAQYEPSAAGSDKRSPQFRWMARDIDAFMKGNLRVNEQWYLENQVLLVVHLLASSSVDWQKGHDSYSLEKLCQVINLDVQRAKKTLDQGATNPTWPEIDVPSAQTGGGSTTKGSRRRRRRRNTKSRGLPASYNGPDPKYPGWNVKRIPRRTGDHVDQYWYRPDLEGVWLRSQTGMKTLIDYMETKGVGIQAAYEEYKGVTKWFRAGAAASFIADS